MSGKIFKRAIAVVTLAALPVVGIAGTASASTRSDEMKVVAKAHHEIGVPYAEYHGNGWYGPIDGHFDCSSLVQYAVYQATHEKLPRTTNEQWSYLSRKGQTFWNKKYLNPGDLIFFWDSRYDIQHVGIYAGHGMMIDADSGRYYGHKVVEEPLGGYWNRFSRVSYGWVK